MRQDTQEEPGTFQEITQRLDQIVAQVRKRDVSLEKSLDLFEEAVRLGNRCSELVDSAGFSPEEQLAAAELMQEGASLREAHADEGKQAEALTAGKPSDAAQASTEA